MDAAARATTAVPGIPRDNDGPVFREPWEAQAFAMALALHGRGLFTLAHRAMAGRDEDEYNLCEGEILCAMVLGWNFGDGHMHNECLIEALQERCGFEPGDVLPPQGTELD